MHLLNSVSSHRIQNVLIDIPHGKVNHKKAQKLRFVEDIMKIEEPHIYLKRNYHQMDQSVKLDLEISVVILLARILK